MRVKDEAKVVAETLENRISGNGLCPHCEHDQFQRWGKANGMQRYRSKNCLRTFNAVTGTPLARLRKKEKGREYAEAMIEGLSIRQAAKKCEVHRTTSFRWRHRFLRTLKDRKDLSLKGIVEADETFFWESFKGARKLPRAARKRGGKAAKRGLSREQIPVLIARDRHGEMTDGVLRDLSEFAVTQVLKPVVAKDAVLCNDGNKAYRAFANLEKIKHVRLIGAKGCRVVDKVYHIQNVNAYDSRLKDWIQRFRGVATKYLPNYLGWRRCLEKQAHTICPETYLSYAVG
ncbi:MAG TPA: IS1595 family transposase [Nitrospina sp.]|nr:IS1595 family transposase [Nitrospina sp.]